MKKLALVVLTALLACACSEVAPPELVRVGAPCFDVEIPSNARAEIISPRFSAENGGLHGDTPDPVTVNVQAGAQPLVLFLFHGGEWRLTGATERVALVLTEDREKISGLTESAEIVDYAASGADRTPPGGFSDSDPSRRRCLRWIRHFAEPHMLPASDTRVVALLGRSLSDFQTARDRFRFDAGRSDWSIRLARMFAKDEIELPNFEDIRAHNVASELMMRQMRDGRGFESHPEHGCHDDDQACRALIRWHNEGAIRFATAADYRRWQNAARRHQAIGHLWTPHIRHAEHRNAYVVMREIDIPSGFTGAHAVLFFLAPGVPTPGGAKSHNLYADLDDGAIIGAFYSGPDR